MVRSHIRQDPHDGPNAHLLEHVQSTLTRQVHFAGRCLRCEFQDEDLVLSGVVRTYYQKQLAQESIRAIQGVGRVRNEIEVMSA